MENFTKFANIPESKRQRIVIVGAGFAGLRLASGLKKTDYQVVLIDRYNFHTFQPLLYQVATAGLEPSAISFPLRKNFQKQKNIHFRMANVIKIETESKRLQTSIGTINYDVLVLATGVKTNFFGNSQLQKNTLEMKKLTQAIGIRNSIIRNYEEALSSRDPKIINACMSIVVVGGGPTGVELSGALAEMKRYVLPRDYPELDFDQMKIYLVEAHQRLLKSMSAKSSEKAVSDLGDMGVIVLTGTIVEGFDGSRLKLAGGEAIPAKTVVWAAGIVGQAPAGIETVQRPGSLRLNVDEFNRVQGHEDLFALGDVAYMETRAFPHGHPQVAPVAVQQAQNLAANLLRMQGGKDPAPFRYRDKGTLATIGRNKAIAEIKKGKFYGIAAWMLWLLVHIMAILGVKNKIFIFINWAWSYVTYDQSLRLLIPRDNNGEE